MGLDDLNESDFFNMIEFNGDVRHWSREGFTGSKTEEFYPATEENKNKAITSVLELAAGGGTNLNEAILAGLEVAETALQREALPRDVKSLVVFLTDGLGSTPGEVIKSNIKTKNRDLQTPVFTVAFGADTDLSLLQSIASQNNAVSQRIYEGSDAALQLEHFYAQISSPVLSNLKFEYVGGLDSSSVSETELNTFFRGGELIVSGKLSTLDDEPPSFGVKISGLGKAGLPYHRELDICPRTSTTDPHPAPQCLQPRVYPKSEAQSFLQKLFAFQHIKQVLEKADIAETEGEKTELEEKATELSLENNFVTDVTSLVVVKPDQEPKVTQFNNLRQTDFPDYGSNYASYAYAAPAPFLAPAPAPILRSSQGYSSNNRRPLPKRRPSSSSSISYGSPVRSSSLGTFVAKSGVKPVRIPLSRRKPVRTTTTPRRKPVKATTTPRRKPVKTTTTPRRKPVKATTTPRPIVPSTPPASEDCHGAGSLVLYSKTYHRGDQLELTNSQPDLAEQQFDQTAVSALLTGGCCWELYSGTNYSGDQITVRPGGQYTSVTSLASLFRNVASVRKVQC